MSVRIYQLSKELDIDNHALLELLQKRGYQVKSPSSTVDNISAESLIAEFGPKKPAPEAVSRPTDAVAEQAQAPVPAPQSPPKVVVPLPKPPAPSGQAPKSRLPEGVFVRSKAEVETERQAREANALNLGVKKRPLLPPMPVTQSSPASPAHKESGVSILKDPNHPAHRNSAAPEPVRTQEPQSNPAGAPQTSPATPPPSSATGPQRRPAPSLRMPMPPPSAQGGMSKPLFKKNPASTQDKGLLQVRPPVVVRDFAKLLDVKPFQLISELMERGIFASMNQVVELEIAAEVAKHHGYTLDVKQRGEPHKHVTAETKAKKVVEEKSELRPPVVCILGHVDHGKTTLLDSLRKTNVVAGEAGGITQHIGAYQILHNGKPITFIDTPGHAAFESMRARGAHLTDIAVLVVAADDGFKPQTDEALKHTRSANVPIIVAINKIDAKGANIDRIKTQMQERGIGPEDWGHDTITVPISALKGQNLDELLDMILLQGELMELQAPAKGTVEAIVLESQIEVGRGPTASVIIQKGTLKPGDVLVCGEHYCKVRTMTDALNQPVKMATPSTPVKLAGWSGAPPAGALALQVKDEREARKQIEALAEPAEEAPAPKTGPKTLSKPKKGIDQLNELLGLTATAGQPLGAAEQKRLHVIVKGDVSGSVEAVCENLKNIPSKKVKVEIVSRSIGPVSPGDIRLAQTTGALIVGFNTRMDPTSIPLAKQCNVQIVQNNIIYKLIEAVEEAMVSLLQPELRENKIGAAEVRQVFNIGGTVIAGCMVTQGQILKNEWIRVLRKKKELFKNKVRTLRRFKDDATEVRAGFECGIQVDHWSDFQEGDILEAYSVESIRPSL